MSESEQLAATLVDLVRAGLAHDAPFGGWKVDEGERVLRGAQALLAAIRSDSVEALLDGASVVDHLGRSWLEIHAECHSLAVALASSLMTSSPGMDVRFHLGYLDGFLRAVAIAAGRRARVTANVYASGEDPVVGLRAFLRQRGIAFDQPTVSTLSREDFLLEVWRFSTDLLTDMSADVVKDFKWQFEESLDLLSTGLDPPGHFCALLHYPLCRVVIQGQRPETVLLVQLKGVVVAFFCEDRASSTTPGTPAGMSPSASGQAIRSECK